MDVHFVGGRLVRFGTNYPVPFWCAVILPTPLRGWADYSCYTVDTVPVAHHDANVPRGTPPTYPYGTLVDHATTYFPPPARHCRRPRTNWTLLVNLRFWQAEDAFDLRTVNLTFEQACRSLGVATAYLGRRRPLPLHHLHVVTVCPLPRVHTTTIPQFVAFV